MVSKPLESKLKDLPQAPGIYKFFDSAGKLLYVGKAKNLNHRVKSYFQTGIEAWSKTAALVSKITDLDYILTFSELEALILEAALIKLHSPHYNIQLKDDKSYLYLMVTTDKIKVGEKKVTVPKVQTARKLDLATPSSYFGPYPNPVVARQVLRAIRKLYPFRDCSLAKYAKYAKLGTPCLFGHLALCPAPCCKPDQIPQTKYNTRQIKKFLAGAAPNLLARLERQMIGYAKKLDFERAAQVRNQLEKYNYVAQTFTSAQKYVENPHLVDDTTAKALSELCHSLPQLTTLPRRIECYDIATISGTSAVGAMVVAIDGYIQKSEYRKFKVKTKRTPDDFAMLKEIIRRRLKNTWPLPELMVVDGGKGQVSAVAAVLDEANLDLPLIGLAKRYETIVYLEFKNLTKAFQELSLPKTNEGLKLLQRLRDEAHRFAQAYHHQLRLKELNLVK